MSISIKCGSTIQVINTGVANVVAVLKNGWLKVCYDTHPGLVFSVRNSSKTVKLLLDEVPVIRPDKQEPNYISSLPDDVIKLIYNWKNRFEIEDKAAVKKAEKAAAAQQRKQERNLLRQERLVQWNDVYKLHSSAIRAQIYAIEHFQMAYMADTVVRLLSRAGSLWGVVARAAEAETVRLMAEGKTAKADTMRAMYINANQFEANGKSANAYEIMAMYINANE